jgi:unsaturated chondroitin disaccharide hydrolase
VDANLEPFQDAVPTTPDDADRDYVAGDVRESWTAGFWPGMLWAAYDHTGADRYRQVAEWFLPAFHSRLAEAGPAENHHDLGFLYLHAALANYDATGRQRAYDTAVEAADQLASRHHSAPGMIQAWDDHRLPGEEIRTIIDTMLNLPLLYRVASLTGRERFHRIAVEHAEQAAEHYVRPDGSTPHTYYFHRDTGAAIRAETHQGYADDSCWARGQAWAIYGFALSHRHSGRERFREAARATAEYFLDALPADLVPPWDFDAGEDIRDTSAAAIAACGLQELSDLLPAADPDRQRYADAAGAILESLTETYTTDGEDAHAILHSGTGHRPNGGYDEPLIYGDYYYLSALLRETTAWRPFATR